MKPKIELGREYPTRGGGKAVVYRDDGVEGRPLIGALYEGTGWKAMQWNEKGKPIYGKADHQACIVFPRVVMVPVEIPELAVSVRDWCDINGDRHIEFFSRHNVGRTPIDAWIASLEGEDE